MHCICLSLCLAALYFWAYSSPPAHTKGSALDDFGALFALNVLMLHDSITAAIHAS